MKDQMLDNSDFQPLTRTKRKCHRESPKQFAEPNNSEALERTLKGVVPKKMQKREQWSLQALTLSASEWITEIMQQTLQREMS